MPEEHRRMRAHFPAKYEQILVSNIEGVQAGQPENRNRKQNTSISNSSRDTGLQEMLEATEESQRTRYNLRRQVLWQPPNDKYREESEDEDRLESGRVENERGYVSACWKFIQALIGDLILDLNWFIYVLRLGFLWALRFVMRVSFLAIAILYFVGLCKSWFCLIVSSSYYPVDYLGLKPSCNPTAQLRHINVSMDALNKLADLETTAITHMTYLRSNLTYLPADHRAIAGSIPQYRLPGNAEELANHLVQYVNTTDLSAACIRQFSDHLTVLLSSLIFRIEGMRTVFADQNSSINLYTILIYPIKWYNRKRPLDLIMKRYDAILIYAIETLMEIIETGTTCHDYLQQIQEKWLPVEKYLLVHGQQILKEHDHLQSQLLPNQQEKILNEYHVTIISKLQNFYFDDGLRKLLDEIIDVFLILDRQRDSLGQINSLTTTPPHTIIALFMNGLHRMAVKLSESDRRVTEAQKVIGGLQRYP